MNALQVAERSAVYALQGALAPITGDAFELMATAPQGVAKLRELILDLAVRGQLVTPDFSGPSADALLQRIHQVRKKLIAAGLAKTQRPHGALHESPFKLPQGWKWATLAEVCASLTDGDHLPPPRVSDGVPFLVIGDVRSGCVDVASASRFVPRSYFDGLDRSRRPQTGDILYTTVGSYGIPVPLTDSTDFCFQRHIALLRPALPEFQAFLALVLASPFVFAQATAAATGTAQRTVSLSALRTIQIPLPPLAEQRRIVARVEDLMGLCDELESHGRLQDEQHARLVATLFDALVASTSPQDLAENWQHVANHSDLLLDRPEAVDALEQTILQLAVRGLLVPQDSADEPARTLIRRMGERDGTRNGHKEVGDGLGRGDNSAAPMLPKGWAWATIDSIASVGTGTTPSRTNPAYFSPASIPWVTSGETSQSFIARTEQGVSPLALRDTSLKVYPVGTLIVAMYGQGKTRGQISELQIEATTNQACAAIVPATVDVGHRRYLKLFFEKIYDEIRELSAGGAQPNLNVGKIKATLVPLPPLAEQRRIVARVEELRAICADLRKHLQQSRATQSHLADALVARAVA